MAIFLYAFQHTMGHEGGYVNDQDDRGGETYSGISRKFNPQWEGWKIIDIKKTISYFPKNLQEVTELQSLVWIFYKQKYWDVFSGDNIDNQNIANELFDTGVNMGTTRACKFFQKALNYLNKNEKLFKDLVEDGKIGKKTLSSYNKLNNKDKEYLYKILNILQGNHYLEYMKKDPKQEKFCRGWLNRVTINK